MSDFFAFALVLANLVLKSKTKKMGPCAEIKLSNCAKIRTYTKVRACTCDCDGTGVMECVFCRGRSDFISFDNQLPRGLSKLGCGERPAKHRLFSLLRGGGREGNRGVRNA